MTAAKNKTTLIPAILRVALGTGFLNPPARRGDTTAATSRWPCAARSRTAHPQRDADEGFVVMEAARLEQDEEAEAGDRDDPRHRNAVGDALTKL